MKFAKYFSLLLTLLSAFGSAQPLFAQGTDLGTIRGLVTDASGAVVPNAKVTILDLGTNTPHETTTNAQGEYRVFGLSSGGYKVSVSAPGMRTAQITGIALNGSDTVNADAVLKVASTNEAVDVLSEAPLVNTEDQTISDTITGRSVIDLPRDSRNVYSFLYLNPNITQSGTDGSFKFLGAQSYGANFSLDGQRSNGGIFGDPTSSQPSLEAVGDINVLSNDFSAEYAGIANIRVTTKRGGTGYHGSAFYNNSNSALAAWTLQDQIGKAGFAPTPIQSKYPNPYFNITDIGGSIGGPIPGLKKTWFFAAYERDWTIRPVNVQASNLPHPSMWGGDFSPFNVKRQFIAYTDIGLFRSEDGGVSWTSSTAGVPKEWLNTTYWVAFDPQVQGRMWSVNSYTHDLPRPKMWRHNSVLNFKGGVCRSDDGGRTWVKSNAGMDQTAATHILLDPASPPEARVLYVTGFGRGVYKSSDGGRTWSLQNQGITQTQPFAWRLARSSNGTLYAVVARRSEDGSIGNAGDGALYRSTDGAEHWQSVALPEGTNGPNGLAIDPNSPDRLYLAAWARATGVHGDGGGIFLSEDGGQSWKQVLDKDRHIYDVTIDPGPDILYAAGFESSAWRSEDRGRHWTRIPGFNFKWGHRVIPDPLDHNKIYITTFGGSVWHGSVNGEGQPVDIATPALEPGQ